MTFAWWHVLVALIPILPNLWSIWHIWNHRFSSFQQRPSGWSSLFSCLCWGA